MVQVDTFSYIRVSGVMKFWKWWGIVLFVSLENGLSDMNIILKADMMY